MLSVEFRHCSSSRGNTMNDFICHWDNEDGIHKYYKTIWIKFGNSVYISLPLAFPWLTHLRNMKNMSAQGTWLVNGYSSLGLHNSLSDNAVSISRVYQLHFPRFYSQIRCWHSPSDRTWKSTYGILPITFITSSYCSSDKLRNICRRSSCFNCATCWMLFMCRCKRTIKYQF